jgi:sugar phosphate isomerase/epimerase
MTPMVHVTTAMFAGHKFESALEMANAGVAESYGAASIAHVQLCPQSHGILDVAMAEQLRAKYPGTRFRPHANVRVTREFHKYDASTPWNVSRPYFERLAEVNHALGGEPYSLHAGRRGSADLARMADNVRRVQDVMGVPVAVEGLYPDPAREWLLGSWSEYAWLLESGLNIAVDLSHLNIVAEVSGERQDALVRELLASPLTREVHISSNSGTLDQHQPVAGSEWWWALLDSVNPAAVFFSEGLLNPLRRSAA